MRELHFDAAVKTVRVAIGRFDPGFAETALEGNGFDKAFLVDRKGLGSAEENVLGIEVLGSHRRLNKIQQVLPEVGID